MMVSLKEGIAGVQQAEDFCFSEGDRAMLLWLPAVGPCWVSLGGDASPKWTWNGNCGRPTLSPSLLVPGKYHGHLIDGELKECG